MNVYLLVFIRLIVFPSVNSRTMSAIRVLICFLRKTFALKKIKFKNLRYTAMLVLGDPVIKKIFPKNRSRDILVDYINYLFLLVQ